MDNQELFNRVAKHLLTQGKKSINPATNRCMYRAPDGCSCAIGCLIPDEAYSGAIEDKSSSHEFVRKAAGLTEENSDLARKLQGVHDSYLVSFWDSQLGIVAESFGLVFDRKGLGL